MTKEELQIYGLHVTKATNDASYISGEEVYEVTDNPGYLVTTYDFLRKCSLPKGIWGIFFMHKNDGLYNIHVNETMLFENTDSIKWCVSILELQKYLREELDGK